MPSGKDLVSFKRVVWQAPFIFWFLGFAKLALRRLGEYGILPDDLPEASF
jgi:hypothetical protein